MKSHRTDGVSLAFGLLFLGIAALWLTGRYVDLDGELVGWMTVGTLVTLGAIGITVAFTRRH